MIRVKFKMLPIKKLLKRCRLPSSRFVEALVRNWDDRLLGKFIVTARRPDGLHYVIDGQTRLFAAEAKFGPDHKVPCEVWYGVTDQDESEMFMAMNATSPPRNIRRLVKWLKGRAR
jgi:hypothetical protein